MGNAALQEAPAIDVLTPYHGEPITDWRNEVVALQRQASKIILEHADPEDALRSARDGAVDLCHFVKVGLRAKHGRTFDRMTDDLGSGQIVPIRANMTIDARILAVLGPTKLPPYEGVTMSAIESLVYQRYISPSTRSAAAAKCLGLMQDGLIRREGSGGASDPFRYFLV